jgi:hypothetical protein
MLLGDQALRGIQDSFDDALGARPIEHGRACERASLVATVEQQVFLAREVVEDPMRR